MIYYQTDFLWRPPAIEPNSVKLFLSSVPLSILKDDFALLFGILNRLMRPDGWILIDAPAGYGSIAINLNAIGSATGWGLSSHNHVAEGLYHPNARQVVYVHYRFGEVKGKQLKTRFMEIARKRPKAHPCEFCPDFISTLIEHYSKPGDVVLDAFCGTGTVPGEAERLKRQGIGCDLRPVSNIRKEYTVEYSDTDDSSTIP